MIKIIFAFLAGYIIGMLITSAICKNLVKDEGVGNKIQ